MDYAKLEIKELAERLRYDREHVHEIRVKSAEDKRKVAIDLDHQCSDTISGWQSGIQKSHMSEKHESLLPLGVLSLILLRMCEDIEPTGVRGVSVVTRDVLNACMSFPDMKLASTAALESLAQYCPDLPSSNGCLSLPIWDRLLSDPKAMRLGTLKNMVTVLGLTRRGTKPILVCRLFVFFGLQRPTITPAKVVNAIRLEKLNKSCDGLHMCQSIGLPVGTRRLSVFSIRKLATMHGYATLCALRGRFEEGIKETIAVEHAKRAKSADRRVLIRFDRGATLRSLDRFCTCGSAPAVRCEFRKCARCCPGPCTRHQNMERPELRFRI